ncbi:MULTISPECIES: response regulator transcription factor [unclassified Cobetia]|uniref:response regulator n=1 Tax=unclassified Cobetia TaxID=2609414 RepID=UPI00159D8B66|nr:MULTISPECIES: response regulator transcription factor [unclassified Cobetia]MCO7232635.1 response regulator transcription factor [Cobetia sp. Dlab-2-AX]MCO7235909.1 response regulator transcription factor [Cobetia sp. Dlab-2-U]NVN54678.1 response regulator transcription factor [bacterium Scap17]
MYRLLIADDHPLFRDAISRTLSLSVADASAAPYELLQAASLAETLSLIDVHADSLDLLLLDLDLPDSHGLEGLRRLRQEADWLPVAILSAHEARETVLEALSLGAVGYLSKSSSAEVLREALARMLAGEVYVPAQLMRAAPRPASLSAPSASASTSAASSTSLPPPAPQLVPSLSEPEFARRWQTLTTKQRGVLERMVLGESNKMIAWQLGVAETTVKSHVSAILHKLEVTSRVQAILLASHALAAMSDTDASPALPKRATPRRGAHE